MPVVPNALERLALLRLNRAPGPMLDLVAAGAFRAATLALDLGVFAALTDGRRTAFDLARTLDADEDALTTLLDFLVAADYLDRDGPYYENTSMTSRWLTDADGGTNLGPYLSMWDDTVFPFWDANLRTAVETGAPERSIYEALAGSPDAATALQHGFLAAAELTLDAVLAAVPVPEGATRLLDVGGGHGRFAAAFVDGTPGLTATVFDRPEAESVARDVAASAGVEDRLTFVAGDYLADDLGDDYDLALVFNVVHAHSPAENRRLLGRVVDALRPGGRVAVLDQFAAEARTPAWEAALGFVDLNYRATVGASVSEYDDVASWLADAGCPNVRRESVGPGTAVFVADAPPADGSLEVSR